MDEYPKVIQAGGITVTVASPEDEARYREADGVRDSEDTLKVEAPVRSARPKTSRRRATVARRVKAGSRKK